MNQLLDFLLELKNNYHVEGIKQSFEDEGALLSDVLLMRKLTSMAGLYMNVKIGGCEAKADILNCIDMSSDGIVGPMIESEFALQKFIESILEFKFVNPYINIESQTAANRIENIIAHPSSKLLKGIIIGRSDLTRSYGKSKDDVDTPFINNVVENICSVVKPHNLKIGMGGNVSGRSANFIKKLHKLGYLDYIETRNVIVSINKDSIKNINKIIDHCLMFEQLWMEYKVNKYGYLVKEYSTRVNTIQNRLKF